jgi:Tfp pilus assembly protein PilZ
MSAVEKRKDVRIPVELGAQIRKGAELYLAKALNLSLSGMFLKVPMPFEEGDLIHVSFHLPNGQRRIEAQAEIRWKSRIENEPIFGVGIHFEQMQLSHREAVASYITRSLKQIA